MMHLIQIIQVNRVINMCRNILIMILLCLFLLINNSVAEQVLVTNVQQYEIKDEKIEFQEVEKYLKQREERLAELSAMKEPESKLRRAEIMFFSSGAMVYFSSLIFVKLFAEFTTGPSSSMPDTYWYFIGFNAIGIAAYVTIKDGIEYADYLVKEKNKQTNLGERNYKLNLWARRF